MKKAGFIAAFLCGFMAAYSQTHATCDDAIAITTDSYGPVIPEGWADSSLCAKGNENMYFGKTHKVIWFSFIVPKDTILTFQIVPENPSDDFDFMLFKADRGDFCMKEKRRKVQPLRTNFAKPTEYSKGVTGLSIKATEAYVPPGFNSPNSLALPVKKGEWYYLVVDNYESNKGGFTLKLPVIVPKPAETKSSIDAMPAKAQRPVSAPNFFIHVLDSANRPVKANLIIEGVEANQSLHADTADYSLVLKPYQSIKIRANADGHMPYQSSYTTAGDTASVFFWVRLQPIRTSEKITLKDIQFLQDSPNITPDSKPALDYVLQFLLNNPNVKVIIKGYVNDPNNTQTPKYDQVLSEKRANSIKDYLAAHGVDKKRMQCIGYGSSKMLYPRPINADQQAANRRVEIEIQ
jgi:outer membrane protein OmpA-like peptidoglycan-associated protein